MAIFESSVQVNKPVEQVWAFLTNPENQRKLSSYITGVEASGPLQLGATYKIETTSMGFKNVTTNEVISFEPSKRFGVKTLAAPPASDVTNTYILEPEGDGTRLTLQMDATLVPAGMPSMPGMEDMMKAQMKAGMDTTMATMKKAIES
jgi:carbon monoxide dehydrogenase subunit G